MDQKRYMAKMAAGETLGAEIVTEKYAIMDRHQWEARMDQIEALAAEVKRLGGNPLAVLRGVRRP